MFSVYIVCTVTKYIYVLCIADTSLSYSLQSLYMIDKYMVPDVQSKLYYQVVLDQRHSLGGRERMCRKQAAKLYQRLCMQTDKFRSSFSSFAVCCVGSLNIFQKHFLVLFILCKLTVVNVLKQNILTVEKSFEFQDCKIKYLFMAPSVWSQGKHVAKFSV